MDMFYNNSMFLRFLCLFICFSYADTGIGFSIGFKDGKSILQYKENNNIEKKKMNSTSNFNVCASFDHWRKIKNNIFIGGDINLGLVNKKITYKDNKIDITMKNNNIYTELFVKLGIGTEQVKVFFGPGVCLTRFTPQIEYKTTNDKKSKELTYNSVKLEEKNILSPFAAFKFGMYFKPLPKLSVDIGYIVGFTSKKMLESYEFSVNDSIPEFDKNSFKFSPKISHVSISMHYRIS